MALFVSDSKDIRNHMQGLKKQGRGAAGLTATNKQSGLGGKESPNPAETYKSDFHLNHT